LENSGGFDGFGAKALADDSDGEDGNSAEILESMTLQEKSDTYEAMLAEHRQSCFLTLHLLLDNV
jgi:hypothetical protein